MKTTTLNEKAFIRLSIIGALLASLLVKKRRQAKICGKITALAGYSRGCLSAYERVVRPGPEE